MNEIRILLVEDNHIDRRMLAKYLRNQENVAVVCEAENGMEALKHLQEEAFDIMVADIIMPLMDGYVLLEEIRRQELAPNMRIIITSELGRDNFITRAFDLGADFYMVKPFEAESLLCHIRRLVNGYVPTHSVQQAQGIDGKLGSLFLGLGMPAHIKGYQFLKQAVKMVISQPDIINRITKELYPGIAKHFGTSASKVERAIRHAIEVAWNRGRIETLNTAFGCKVCTQQDKPTNGEFIAMIADKLAVEQRSA